MDADSRLCDRVAAKINPCDHVAHRMVRMDLRIVTIDVARQEVMTRANVPSV